MLQADSVHFDDVLMSDTRKTERDNYLRNFVQNAPCKCRLPTTMGVCWASIASRCFQKRKFGAFMSCAFLCRSCRQHKWLLHDVDNVAHLVRPRSLLLLHRSKTPAWCGTSGRAGNPFKVCSKGLQRYPKEKNVWLVQVLCLDSMQNTVWVMGFSIEIVLLITVVARKLVDKCRLFSLLVLPSFCTAVLLTRQVADKITNYSHRDHMIIWSYDQPVVQFWMTNKERQMVVFIRESNSQS